MENSIKDQIIYRYSNFVKDIKKIEQWLTSCRKGFTTFGAAEWEPELIVSINRGGLVPGVYLSHALKIPHYPVHYQTRDFQTPGKHDKSKWFFSYKPHAINYDKNVLLVDDINDTGKTIIDIMDNWSQSNLGDHPLTKRVKTTTLVERKSSEYRVDFSPTVLDNTKWVVFPWESQNRDGYDKEEEEE